MCCASIVEPGTAVLGRQRHSREAGGPQCRVGTPSRRGRRLRTRSRSPGPSGARPRPSAHRAPPATRGHARAERVGVPRSQFGVDHHRAGDPRLARQSSRTWSSICCPAVSKPVEMMSVRRNAWITRGSTDPGSPGRNTPVTWSRPSNCGDAAMASSAASSWAFAHRDAEVRHALRVGVKAGVVAVERARGGRRHRRPARRSPARTPTARAAPPTRRARCR